MSILDPKGQKDGEWSHGWILGRTTGAFPLFARTRCGSHGEEGASWTAVRHRSREAIETITSGSRILMGAAS